jgi:hypothetical protein
MALVVVGMLLGAGPVSAAPAVRSEATIRWTVKWTFGWNRGFDLDSGRVTSVVSAMETWLVFSSYPPPAGMWVIGASPGGNSSRFRAWSGRPGYAACRNNRTWDDAAGPQTDPDGTWLCVRTTGGRVARMRILHWPTKSERFFRFSYRTWQRG